MITLKIELSEEQWGVVVNAVETMGRLIERGDFGEEDVEDNEEWMKELAYAEQVIGDALLKEGAVI